MDERKKLLLLLGLLSRAALGQPAAAPPAGATLTLNPCYDLAEAHDLRQKIQAPAAVPLDHGLIGFGDYFTEANNLTLARLSEQLHRLQLLQAQVDYQTTGSTPAPSR